LGVSNYFRMAVSNYFSRPHSFKKNSVETNTSQRRPGLHTDNPGKFQFKCDGQFSFIVLFADLLHKSYFRPNNRDFPTTKWNFATFKKTFSIGRHSGMTSGWM
jgi:hypothetical protein